MNNFEKSEPSSEKVDPVAELGVISVENFVPAPQGDLTPDEIHELMVHRGQALTREEIDNINAARKLGKHTSIV